jgi:hypothetical protein
MIDENNTNRIIYSNPIKCNMNYQPLSTTGEIIASGNEFINRLVVYTSPTKAKNIHNFDRFYVFIKPPKEYDKFCADADFYVDGEPMTFLNESRFYLQRMIGDVDE